MTRVLPQWSDKLAERMARGLGMPRSSEWAVILSAHAPSRGEPRTPCFIKRASDPPDVAHCFTLPFEEVEAAEGFPFQVFGSVTDEPATPFFWQLEPTPGLEHGLKVEVWAVAIAIGSTMRAELRYDPATGRMRRTIEIEDPGDDWERDVSRIKRAVRALHMKVLRAGGRPRGSRKGRVWERQDYLDWYREAGSAYAREDKPLTLKDLGDAQGISDDTAARRLRDPAVDLPWPPEAHLEIWDPDE